MCVLYLIHRVTLPTRISQHSNHVLHETYRWISTSGSVALRNRNMNYEACVLNGRHAFWMICKLSLVPLVHKAILCFCTSVGTFTSVANPIAWSNLTTYQVMSSCHQSRPCLAEYSKAWWLLCHPSPNASNATHLNRMKFLSITYLILVNSAQ